jgi:hypothetical protein
VKATRRQFISATAGGFAPAASSRILGPRRTDTLPEALLGRTRAALDRQRGAIIYRDVIGIADFLLPSSTARFYIAVVEIYQPLTEASETIHIRSIDGS